MGVNINIEEEYVPMIQDVIKMFVILVVLNLLMFISNPKVNKIMGESYIKLMSFIILGVLTYWLIVKKLINYNNNSS